MCLLDSGNEQLFTACTHTELCRETDRNTRTRLVQGAMRVNNVECVVVDDSQFMRSVLTNTLEENGISVIGKAENGVEAVTMVTDMEPDIVTMDVEMPEMNGVEAVRKIMDKHPTPILMVSAYTNKGARVTLEALDNGAIDFFEKPGGEVSMEVNQHGEQLASVLKTVATADMTQAQSGNQARTQKPETETEHIDSKGKAFVDTHTVVIGSSTGGPEAVERVMQQLPGGDCRVIIVQHMPAEFTGRFAERLDESSDYDVVEAENRLRIGKGEAVVARGDSNMVIQNYRNGQLRVKVINDDFGYSALPAVDVTMKSVAETITDPLTGVILTGMGADGAEGMKAIHEAGGNTIAQNKGTCVIYGMPKQAVETGCVNDVVGIDEVASQIRSGAE